MNIKFHNEIINQVRRTWDYIRPASSRNPARRIDPLVKMNLPPLMGRRDAAYDRAAQLIQADLFAGTEETRAKTYVEISALLAQASEDTRAVLRTLSSPDTERREKNFLKLILMLENISRLLENLVLLEEGLFRNLGSTPLSDFDVRRGDAEIARNERTLTETEINLANQMRSYFDRASIKVNRYREYTTKNFSKSNALRYRKAYDIHSGLFTEEKKPQP